MLGKDQCVLMLMMNKEEVSSPSTLSEEKQGYGGGVHVAGIVTCMSTNTRQHTNTKAKTKTLYAGRRY